MEKVKELLRQRPAAARLLRLLAVAVLAVAVTLGRHTWSKYYTGSWDGYSELTAVGRIIQVQQGWSSHGGFLGIYTEEWGDGEGYHMLKEPPQVSDNDGYKVYTHQSGLQGTLSGMLARLLRGIDGETRLNALYFVNSVLFYGLALGLCLALGRRFGVGAGLAAAVAVVFAPWLTMGAKNLYWVLWTWLLPCAAGAGQAAFFRREGRFSGRWLVLAFAAVLVRCLCGFEYISTFLVLMEIPLVLVWLDAPGKRMDCFRQLVYTGIAGVLGAVAGLLIWLVQCWRYFRSFSQALECVLGTALARVGVEGTGVDVIELAEDITRLGTIKMFLTDGTPMVSLGGVAVTLPLLLAAAFAALVLVTLLRPGDARRAQLWMLFALSGAAPISWMFLAKEHVALHAHLSPMLWHFALVPVCAAAIGCGAETVIRRLLRR